MEVVVTDRFHRILWGIPTIESTFDAANMVKTATVKDVPIKNYALLNIQACLIHVWENYICNPLLVVPLISARVTLISTRVSAHRQAILFSVTTQAWGSDPQQPDRRSLTQTEYDACMTSAYYSEPQIVNLMYKLQSFRIWIFKLVSPMSTRIVYVLWLKWCLSLRSWRRYYQICYSFLHITKSYLKMTYSVLGK